MINCYILLQNITIYHNGRIERANDPIIVDIMARPLSCDFDEDELVVFGKHK
jgi:hypothetical protein